MFTIRCVSDCQEMFPATDDIIRVSTLSLVSCTRPRLLSSRPFVLQRPLYSHCGTFVFQIPADTAWRCRIYMKGNLGKLSVPAREPMAQTVTPVMHLPPTGSKIVGIQGQSLSRLELV